MRKLQQIFVIILHCATPLTKIEIVVFLRGLWHFKKTPFVTFTDPPLSIVKNNRKQKKGEKLRRRLKPFAFKPKAWKEGM